MILIENNGAISELPERISYIDVYFIYEVSACIEKMECLQKYFLDKIIRIEILRFYFYRRKYANEIFVRLHNNNIDNLLVKFMETLYRNTCMCSKT